MKRYGNLYEQIYSMDNLRKAHKNARKGKGWYEEVKEVDANIEVYLKQLQEMAVIYATLIIKGKKTFADVPAKIQDKVKEVLIDLDCPELAE